MYLLKQSHIASEKGFTSKAPHALIDLGSRWLGKQTIHVHILQALSISLKLIKSLVIKSVLILMRPYCSMFRCFGMWYCFLGLRNSLPDMILLFSLFGDALLKSFFLTLSAFMSLTLARSVVLLHRRFVPSD